ncbi:hypothetical protein M0804_000040 [Polistes exclamans]|nr:hypothetical protein M0804_000040 [Polistes exclamans]
MMKKKKNNDDEDDMMMMMMMMNNDVKKMEISHGIFIVLSIFIQFFRDFSVFMHIMKAATATGILFLPNAFRRTGYVMSIICGLLIGLIYTHNSVVLVQCAQELCRRHRLPKLDFAETVEVSFLMGPERTRRHGKTFAVFTNVVVCFIQYKTVVIFILYVASSFQQVIEFVTKITLDVRVYVIIFCPIYCLMILVPNLKYLTPFSVIGTIFFIMGIGISLIYFLDDFSNPKRLDPFTNIYSVPMFSSIFLFALHNITIFLPLENTMKNPRNMPRLIIIATILNTLIYVTFGFLGYNKYKESCDTVIKNLPINEILAQLTKIGIAISVLFSIGITYIIPVSIIWPIIMNMTNLEDRHEIIFRLAGILIATFVAIAIPKMIPLSGLLAALGMTSSMLFIPILLFGAMESVRTMLMAYTDDTKEEDC